MADPPDTMRLGSGSMNSSVESTLVSGDEEWVRLEEPPSLHTPHSHHPTSRMPLQSTLWVSALASSLLSSPSLSHPSPHHMEVRVASLKLRLDPVIPLLRIFPCLPRTSGGSIPHLGLQGPAT